MILLGDLALTEVPDAESFLKQALEVESIAKTTLDFRDKEPTEITPEDSFWVAQQEMVVVQPGLGEYVGSSEATSCLIMAIWDPATGRSSLGHLDGSKTRGTVAALLKAHPNNQTLHLHLAGACLTRGHLPSPLEDVLQQLAAAPHQLTLVTACVGSFNTELKDDLEFPLTTSLALHLPSGATFPASFQSREPMSDLRLLRVFGSSYDDSCPNVLTDDGDFVITPFIIPKYMAYTSYLNRTDKELLGSLSTTPHSEGPTFCDDLRNAFRYALEHPTFPSPSPLHFARVPGEGWQLKNPSSTK